MGGADVFEPFLRRWIENNKFKSVTTEQFRDFFHSYFRDNEGCIKVDWEGWLNKPGMPPVDLLPQFDHTLVQESKSLAEKWINFKESEFVPSKEDVHRFNTFQFVAFLEHLELQSAPSGLSVTTLDLLQSAYDLNSIKNSEIRMCWYSLALMSKYQKIFSLVVEFLGEQGRMKFIRPLYRALFSNGEEGRRLAESSFAKFSSGYHNIASKMIQQDFEKLSVPK